MKGIFTELLRLKGYLPSIKLWNDKYGFWNEITQKAGQLAEDGVPFSNVKTKRFLIGAYGVSTYTENGIALAVDANFPNSADMVESVKDLGASVIPAFARILDVKTVTLQAFNPASTFVAETGTSSSGAELIASATVKALNAITAMAHATGFNIAPNAADQHVYVSATPGSNWSTITTGVLAVYVTYIEI